ncbi:MAG: hypothetical protein KF911_01645 [Pseudomonadales bacterium]|nr:hypothetical protein [Pseudomonadales bacterium]
MRPIALAICTPLLICSVAAFAAWHEAVSDHFVIYANDSERDVTHFSRRLERFRAAMESGFPPRFEKPSPSNRLTIYIVRDATEVAELYPGDAGGGLLVGFFVPRAGASVSVIAPVDAGGVRMTRSESWLFHAYANQFRHENIGYAAPSWYGAGFAEYFSAVRFFEDGSVGIGLPASHRAREIRSSIRVSLTQVLDPDAYASRKGGRYDNFQGQSWLLFHYLYSDEIRKEQLVDYLERLTGGERALDAARGAFGDLAQLDRALHAYFRRPRLPFTRIPADALTIGPVAVRKLNEAESASIPIRIRSQAGVDELDAVEVVTDARALAARYPDEPEVLAALAAAEFDAGNDDAAIAAADSTLNLNPTQVNALIVKGRALFRIARESGDRASWANARSHWELVRTVEADHPIALFYLYLSFIEQGQPPEQNAVEGLERALRLAPYDTRIRLATARQQMNEQRFAAVVQTLAPWIFDSRLADDSAALEMLDAARREFESGAP